jgi:hypothetical protein
MRYQEINIVGEEYADDNRHWSAQHCVNYLPVPAERGGSLTQWQLRQAPGLKPLVRIVQDIGDGELADVGPVRGMREVEGKLFVVAGNTLYQISNGLVAIPYGTVPGVGRVSMTHNQRGLGNELLIVNGSAGYVFNTSTLVFQRITDEGYPGAFIADYIDSYLAQVEPQGRFWFHSDLADALNYNTLDRYEAEGQPDRIVSLKVSHREALLFGQKTIEPYVNDPSGDGTAPFQRASNTVIECGCSAKFSVAALDNSVFFLDDKRIVRRLDGYNPVRLSTQPIEQALAACTADQIAAAYAFVWEDRGHKVYYLTVPGQFTIGYDVLSRRWHRRLTKGMDRWRLSDLVFWNGKWVGGDYQSGRLYELDWAYALDGQDSEGEPLELVRRTASGYLSANQNRIRVHALELRCRVGGPETVPADFPEQPEGPAISGGAPDGVVGAAWSGYTYTGTGGTPPLKFTLRSGTLPPGVGPLSQAGTIAAGTPTAGGTYTFVVRVTDANGLFDELTDVVFVDVVIPWLMAGIFTNSAEIKPSVDGVDWTQNATRISIPPSSYWSPGTRGRLFRWGNQILATTTSNAFGPVTVISNDLGATWEDAGISSLDSPSGDAAKIGGNIYVASTLLSINYTQKIEPDGTVTGTGWAATALAEDGDYLYNTRDIVSNNVFVRDSSGAYVRDAQYNTTGQNPKTTQLCCGNGLVVATWTTNEPTVSDSRFHIASSSDQGATWTQHANPFGDAIGNSDAQTRLCYSEGLGKWLVTFGSRVAVGDSPATLVQSAHVFGQVPRGMDEDGKKFVICGDNQLMERTVDGVNFTSMTVTNTTASTDLDDVLPLGYVDE